MRAIDTLIVTESRGRRIGKTTVMVEAAKKIGAIYICATMKQAKEIAREHGIMTASMESELRGTKGPYLWDHHALMMAAIEATHDFAKLKADYSMAKQEVTIANSEIRYLSDERKRLLSEVENLKKRIPRNWLAKLLARL